MTSLEPVDNDLAPASQSRALGVRDHVSPTFPDPDLGLHQPGREFSTVSTAPTSTTDRKIYLIETNPVDNNRPRVKTRGYEIGGTK